MSLVALFLLLVLILILTRLPIDAEIKNIGFIVIFIALVVLVLRLLGVWV